MAVVVLAHDRILNEAVAIKSLRKDFAGDPQWHARLAREVKLARQLRHPNVCRVFDFGQTEDGQVFIVMELARETLRAGLNRRDGADEPWSARLADVVAIAAGLAAIHEAGILHRDLSTQNILRHAEGRLVVADFGLAAESDETAATLRGGTPAYMAPEVAAGGRASFATDVWSLGVVIHEIVFGRRPSWLTSIEKGIQRPDRPLSRPEYDVWTICRRCTAADPARRPADARVVAKWLQRIEATPPERAAPPGGKSVVIALGALAATLLGSHHEREQAKASSPWPGVSQVDTPLHVLGTPADWTQSSRVLLGLPERIACLLALPDHRTLRLVWGAPRTAEDLDIVTGQRRRSPLVPEAYAVGCPDLSPDGQQLIFEGYDGAGRPAIFRSPHPDGSAAAPTVRSAEPGFATAPKWLSDGAAFAFNLDSGHAGILEGSTDHLIIASTTPVGDFREHGWMVGGARLYLTAESPKGRTSCEVLQWPSLDTRQSFTVPFVPFDCQTYDHRTIYCNDTNRVIFAIHPNAGIVIPAGEVRGQGIGFLAVEPDGLAFISQRSRSEVWGTQDGTQSHRLTSLGTVLEAASCGGDVFLLTRDDPREGTIVSRRESDGPLTDLAAGSFCQSPVCAHGGAEWWFARFGPTDPGFFHCTASGCALISHDVIHGAALSPEGTRIAYVAPTNRGMGVRLMSKLGGAVRDVADTETSCAPGWTSNDTLWISRRRRGAFVWTEIDAHGTETGRTVSGAKDCTDGHPDPLSPVRSDVRVVVERQSEVRWKSFP